MVCGVSESKEITGKEKEMTNEELAWAAGFFDGEGCVMIVKKRSAHAIRLAVCQVNPTPINLFKKFFGGHTLYSTPKNKNWHPQWKWEQDSKSAYETLTKLLPYLIVKKDAVELALEFQKLKKKGRKITEQDLIIEQEFKSKISHLNRKD